MNLRRGEMQIRRALLIKYAIVSYRVKSLNCTLTSDKIGFAFFVHAGVTFRGGVSLRNRMV